jgi:hypothetical protein
MGPVEVDGRLDMLNADLMRQLNEERVADLRAIRIGRQRVGRLDAPVRRSLRGALGSQMVRLGEHRAGRRPTAYPPEPCLGQAR